jgi:CheY-like chemotaxis protein
MSHILLVDDKNLMVQLFKCHLEVHGYRVTIAHDSVTALDTVKRKAVDAVITDISMPGLNDEELLPQLRAYQPELPAIIVSGYTRNFTWDIDDKTKLFSKPVDLPQLLASLDVLVHAHTELTRAA